jgi:hypothetical protein
MGVKSVRTNRQSAPRLRFLARFMIETPLGEAFMLANNREARKRPRGAVAG